MSSLVAATIEIARAHQDLAYALMFVLAMSESLPVVGALVPGTAIIVGVSALIPSGAVSPWPMVVSATLGAVVGDGVSYWLGRRYHRDITGRWPLRHYPKLIARGEAFFLRHGGKSVFIARFTPGVRAVVPVIAGMLLMSPARFYGMNVLSALLWAPSHVLAGATLGASLALLGAVAGRLAIFVVVLIAVLWGAALAMGYAIRRLPPLAARAVNRLWVWARARDSWLSRQLVSLLDPARREMPGLALLGAILLGGLWLFFGVLEDVISGDPLVRADTATFHFLQSLRTGWVDRAMVAVAEFGDWSVIISVALLTFLWLAWRRACRAAAYELAAVGAASLFSLLINVTLHAPRANGAASNWDAFAFPSGHITVSAALYGFLTILAAWEAGARGRAATAIGATLLVSAIGFSRLYLGAHWLSGVLGGFAFGVAWATLLGIVYLRRNPPRIGAGGLCTTAVATLLVVGAVHVDRQHAADMNRYAVRETIRTMPLARWWQRGWSELPVRRVDLAGALDEPITVQWAGGLGTLEKELAAKGWSVPVPWTVRSALAWLAPNIRPTDLPVLPRLQDGHQEALVMIFPVGNGSAPSRLVFRLWKSDFVLGGTGADAVPLWVGTVAEERFERIMSVLTVIRERDDLNAARTILASAMASTRLAERGASHHGPGWDGAVLLGRAPGLPLASRWRLMESSARVALASRRYSARSSRWFPRLRHSRALAGG